MHSQGGRLCAGLKANKGKLKPDVGAFGFTDRACGTCSHGSSRTLLPSTGRHGASAGQAALSAQADLL